MRESLLLRAVAVPRSADDDSPVGEAAEEATNIFVFFIEALFRNGYQTGTALIFATVALIIMVNIKTNKVVSVGVAIGAFWGGWLAWNTVQNRDFQLFPGDVQATRLIDIAFTSDLNFLLVVIVACFLAYFLWRKGTSIVSRILLFAAGILGASLVYNVYEAIRFASS